MNFSVFVSLHWNFQRQSLITHKCHMLSDFKGICMNTNMKLKCWRMRLNNYLSQKENRGESTCNPTSVPDIELFQAK